MNKHTEGPWQVKSEHEPEYIIGAIDGPDDGTMYYRPVAMVSETDDFDANARLIAAAPDLLRQLRYLEIAANTVDGCYTRNPGNFAAALRDLRECAEQARAVFAKATGETP